MYTFLFTVLEVSDEIMWLCHDIHYTECRQYMKHIAHFNMLNIQTAKKNGLQSCVESCTLWQPEFQGFYWRELKKYILHWIWLVLTTEYDIHIESDYSWMWTGCSLDFIADNRISVSEVTVFSAT
jgi:hypothetical protein